MANSQSLCYLFLVVLLAHGALANVDDQILNINPNAPRTRGNRFAIAFMNNHKRDEITTIQQIAMFVTSEEESSSFTVETRWDGVRDFGFTEDTDTGIFSRNEVARRGDFTFISFPAGQQVVLGGDTDPDIAVQTNGDNDEADRQKGLIVTADNSDHELTIYVLSDETVSTDAFLAINCVTFPNTRDYRYFIFSTGTEGIGETFNSRFLFTPCEDDTLVEITPSQLMSHPTWVSSSLSQTDPQSVVIRTAEYGRAFDRFDTVMLSNLGDLTGTIVQSDKPLSVFSGHQCGTPTADGTCDYLVEQIPPHPTYGDLFFMAPYAVRQSGELYRIGSIENNVEVTVNCECEARTSVGSLVALTSSVEGVYTATLNRGEFTECKTPTNAKTYCCVTSSKPVTMVGFTLGNLIDNLAFIQDPMLDFNPIGDPSMVYIPPASSYLNGYSLSTAKNLTTSFQGFVSYILPTNVFDNSEADQQRFRINGETSIPDNGYSEIYCRIDGVDQVCAYGATKFLGVGNFDISYDNIGGGAFWGFVYGYAREVSFAYPLAYEMEPTGLAWVQGNNRYVLEADVEVDVGFEINRGSRVIRSRAFAYTQDNTATAGSDYTATGVRPGSGENSNLRFRATRNTPNIAFIVMIMADDTPEPVEVIDVFLECEAEENCYAPVSRYTISIVD